MTMELPVLLISNGVLLPEQRMKIPVRSKTNLATLDRFILNKSSTVKSMILVAYRAEDEKRIFPVGTVALVEQVVTWQYNSLVVYTLHVVGISRAQIDKFAVPLCEAKQLYDIQGEFPEDRKNVFLGYCKKLADYLGRENMEGRHTINTLLKEGKIDSLTDCALSHIHNLSYDVLLNYLGTVEVEKRVEIATVYLERLIKDLPSEEKEKVSFTVENMLPHKGVKRIPGNQRKTQQKPLEKLEQKLEEAELPDAVRDQVMQEMERLKQMGANSNEHHVLTNYLELVASLPWNKATEEEIDIPKARQLLNASHDGMENVKGRVLEYLAVRKLTERTDGPILCFSGPPGTGKTSVAKAIAAALGRKFERISLGGIRDESDIRGHRRTYVAAMAGRLIQSIKHAGSNNPVILLDEVDKLYSGVNGSPSAALLEVLDPEQNSTFVDHYLNLPFDLSNVLFIATANDISTIDSPLLDRMELIEMSGYSTHEKLRIATNHVIPRQMAKNGVIPDYIQFKDEALRMIVNGYTRESGVRQMERTIGAVCRKTALRLAEAFNWDCTADVLSEMELPIVVDAAMVETIMGPLKFSRLDLVEKMRSFRPGMCFGMAWTPFGGELMMIEASICKGKGRLLMTGKLGEVLKESVDVARSWIRTNTERYSVHLPSDSDLHVHLPSGSIGKDGPSAGCAIVCTLFSLASNRNVRSDTSVTGEISLTGQVLPVGGIKEKVLGAHRNGLRRVVLPEANRRDVRDVEEEVKNEMSIEFVNTADELIEKMMEKNESIDILSKL